MAEDILNEDFMLTTEKHRIVKRTFFTVKECHQVLGFATHSN
jgi:hypothetical protein